MGHHVMIALMGEQPMPNLLPVRCEKPKRVVLVYTDRTEASCMRLKCLLKDVLVEPLKIDSQYDIAAIHKDIKSYINENNLTWSEIVFNLTGGTKPMALASYQLANELSTNFLYLQSEGRRSLIYHYEFIEGNAKLIKQDVVPSVLSIDDYLSAHLGSYNRAQIKGSFEMQVNDALNGSIDEIEHSIIHGALEIDLVIRCGNQVGIAEIKGGKKALKKDGIDQLNTAGEQRYLGTYTKKFLILDRKIGTKNRELAEAHRIKIIELPSAELGNISPDECEELRKIIRKDLGAT